MCTAILSDSRLMMLAQKIPKGSVVADIGTDHGYLPCYLVQSGISNYAYACDIGEKSLAKARKLIKTRELEDKVKVHLADGLKGLPLDKLTHIIVAGMGGQLISEILGACPNARRQELRFILQPMVKPEYLRRWLCQNGFDIFSEDGVSEGRFTYTVMEAAYTGVTWNPDPLFVWAGKLAESKQFESKLMLRRISAKLNRIGSGMMLSSSNQNQKTGQEYLALSKKIALLGGI